jgi:uncharacterized protein (TIGR03382 family)
MKLLLAMMLVLLSGPLIAATTSTLLPDPVPPPSSNNFAPTIVVAVGGNPVLPGDKVQVDYGDTVAALNVQITVSDGDMDNTSLTAFISNLGNTGIDINEWESVSRSVSYTVNPTTGTFNTPAGVTHTIFLGANDGSAYWTDFIFEIVQAANPSANAAPSIEVSTAGNTIANGQTVNVGYNDTLAGLNLVITVDDADADDTAVTASISNLGNTGIDINEWESASQPVTYTINPSTGNFNTAAGATHQVTLTANDGTNTTVFTFDIVQAAHRTNPSISLSDGATISPGQSAAGTNRAFGDWEVGDTSTTVTVTIANNGSADLALSGFGLTGDTGEFVLDTNGVPPFLPSGATAQFTINFVPTSTGSKSAMVQVGHDDPSVPDPFVFEITGTGTTPGGNVASGTGGTTDAGGCSSSGTGSSLSVLLLALLGVTAVRRKRRSRA